MDLSKFCSTSTRKARHHLNLDPKTQTVCASESELPLKDKNVYNLFNLQLELTSNLLKNHRI